MIVNVPKDVLWIVYLVIVMAVISVLKVILLVPINSAFHAYQIAENVQDKQMEFA